MCYYILENKILVRIICAIQNFIIHLHELIINGMRIISHRKLREFYETKGREDSKVALERWYQIAEDADWRNFSDIRVDFPDADYVGNQHYVFNIRGNNYRLVVVIKFMIGRLFIRFVGTHKEYDKIDCSTI